MLSRWKWRWARLKTLWATSPELPRLAQQLDHIEENLQRQALLLGSSLARTVYRQGHLSSIHQAEFSVFSQWGDDGVIQYLTHLLDVHPHVFVEFGVDDYREATTRFLLMHNNWTGLVMDGSPANIERIRQDDLYWRFDLIARAAFVTAENVNDLIASAGITGGIGLLHIDTDGNDYWIWKALHIVNPVIAILEYNSVLGIDRAITIPYSPNFARSQSDPSNLYFGASLLALGDLAEQKGYAFIGCTSSGNNAYFVRTDKLGPLRPLLPRDGYVESRFRESRDETGRLTYLRGGERLQHIKGRPIFNTRTGHIEEL